MSKKQHVTPDGTMAQCLWVMTAAKKKGTTSCMTFHCSEAVAFFEADVWHELIPLSPLGCEHVPATCPTDRTSQLDTRRYGNHYFWWVHICMLCVPRAAKCYVIDFKYPAQIFFCHFIGHVFVWNFVRMEVFSKKTQYHNSITWCACDHNILHGKSHMWNNACLLGL